MAADLVNTYAWHGGREKLVTLADARRFMTEHGQNRRLTAGDIPKLHALRDAVRAVFLADGDAEAERHINALLARYPAQPRIRQAGGHADVVFESQASDFVHWLGTNAAIGLAFFVSEHGFARIGTCAADDCADAYVDVSKNSHKLYCSNGCARNQSVRAFRRRKRVAAEASGT